MCPLCWLGHFIHVISYVLLISTVDDILISTVMIKWVRVYVSLKIFKRGDPPIVIHELWHQNLNKEDLSRITLCLSCEWFDDLMIDIVALLYWYCCSSVLSLFREISCIFSFSHFVCRKEGAQGQRDGASVGQLTICPALGVFSLGSISF